MQLLRIEIGGTLGSVCRYRLSAVVQRVTSPFFPYGTFAVKVAAAVTPLL